MTVKFPGELAIKILKIFFGMLEDTKKPDYFCNQAFILKLNF